MNKEIGMIDNVKIYKDEQGYYIKDIIEGIKKYDMIIRLGKEKEQVIKKLRDVRDWVYRYYYRDTEAVLRAEEQAKLLIK